MASVADGTWVWIVRAVYGDDVPDVHIFSTALEARHFCESYSCINCNEPGKLFTKDATAIYSCSACGDAGLAISRKRVNDPHPPNVFDCDSAKILRDEVRAELELLPPSTPRVVPSPTEDEEGTTASASASGKREREPTTDATVDAAKRTEVSQESKRARSDEDA